MPDFRTIAKEGWHPKGHDGGKESWRSDFKGINQVAGWMGKGKDANSSERSERVAQPLSSLKDPSSFGPPPKHVKYHGAATLPNQTTPDRSGLGAPLPQEHVAHQNYRQQQQQQEEEMEAQQAHEEAEYQRPTAPAPYRVDTTGLRTDHLPPPPKRVDSPASPASSNARPKPGLPPRLPSRTNSTPVSEPTPPPAYSPVPSASDGYVNQGAASRLASAGVSVPALGIDRSQEQSTPASPAGQAPVNELQSRFSQMRTSSNSSYSRTAPPPPPQPRSCAQDVREDSSPASGGIGSKVRDFRGQHSDKIDAGKQKMNNFREQHSDKIDAGKQRVNSFREEHSDKIDAGKQKMGGFREQHSDKVDAGKQKMGGFREQHSDKIDAGKQKMSGLSQRFNNYVDGQKSLPSNRGERPPPPAPRGSTSAASAPSPTGVDIAKKKPPPPPPKRAEMRASSVQPSPTPPPVPLSTRPR